LERKEQEMAMLQEQAAQMGMPTQPNPEIMAQLESQLGIQGGKVPGLQLN
jgi:hypothetical protein